MHAPYSGADVVRNEYDGFKLSDAPASSSSPVVVPTLSWVDDPATFFADFVSRRKPCVLDFHPVPTTTTTTTTISNKNKSSSSRLRLSRQELERHAGDETVQVEKRRTPRDSFGKSRTKTQLDMTVRDFTRHLTTTPTPTAGDHKKGDDDKVQPPREEDQNEDDQQLYYLTTQEGDDDDDDDPFARAPCRQLREAHLVPSELPLAGNLLLSACNMWIGNSPSGSSSGLHHDHHDNFYLLLKGSKRFRLFSPDRALHMETHGTIERVHHNGRVSYQGSECRSDGVPLAALSDEEEDDDDDDIVDQEEFERRRTLRGGEDASDDDDEEEIVLGQGADYDSSDDEREQHGDADDFDELMAKEDGTVTSHDDNDDGEDHGEEIGDDDSADDFDALMQGHNDDDDDTDDDEQEFVLGKGHDYEGSDDDEQNDRGDVDDFDELMKHEHQATANDSDEEEDEEEFVLGKGHDYDSSDDDEQHDRGDVDDFDELMKQENNQSDSDDDEEEFVLGKGHDYDSSDGDYVQGDTDDFDELVQGEDEAGPDSFSRITPEVLADQHVLARQFPKVATFEQGVIELRAGQSLYLPAGWFHEVTSVGNNIEQAGDTHEVNNNDDEDGFTSGSHLALNYWYHPPDKLDDYQRPYRSDFWKLQQGRVSRT